MTGRLDRAPAHAGSADGGLRRRIWEWLPARTARCRVTIPSVIASALGVPLRDVTTALDTMQRAGHAIRDRSTGIRSSGWHRGTPIPPDPAPPQGEDLTLWP